MARKAVVVGATNGIGKACSHRLAGAGFDIIAVGRARPGRAEAIVSELNARSPEGSSPCHEFRPCDAFSLGAVKECAEGIAKDHTSVDALVMSQGMATIQSFTWTVDGNDEKLTLHYWSRMAFATCLLPSLRTSSMPGGSCVMSILSGGVHSPYKNYVSDPFLKKSYSVKNAADSAGYYTDLFMDATAKGDGNEKIRFIHAAPGFVNSNWGTEFPRWLRLPVRCMQGLLAMDPAQCAVYMCDPILKSASGSTVNGGRKPGLFILNEDATEGKLTKAHTAEATDIVWKFTADVLGKVGIDVNKS